MKLSLAFGSEKSAIKMDAVEALRYAAVAGPIERGRFMAMTGLPERLPRRVLASLTDYGLLTSATSRVDSLRDIPWEPGFFVSPSMAGR